jgi:hypothetical protein
LAVALPYRSVEEKLVVPPEVSSEKGRIAMSQFPSWLNSASGLEDEMRGIQ